MAFSLLLDEMTEVRLAEYCRKLGHDTERVVTVASLGPGSDDSVIVDYAERENRLLVTYDDDFLTNHGETTDSYVNGGHRVAQQTRSNRTDRIRLRDYTPPPG
ncbi:MAG: DUF5615 family PIN-like protein [Haloarculaceae archaeon]